MIAMGQLNDDRFGIECSGIVSCLGSKNSGFKIGDRVCTVSEETLSNYTRYPQTSAWKVPADMTSRVAATRRSRELNLPFS